VSRGLRILGSAVVRRGEREGTIDLEIGADSWKSIGSGIVGGTLAMSAWKAHPVVAFLDGYELGSTAMDVRTGAIDKTEALRRLGRTAIATVATLLLPVPGLFGWLAGAIAAQVVIPDGDRTLVERARSIIAQAEDSTTAMVRQTEETI
jgi:hypothetical protein